MHPTPTHTDTQGITVRLADYSDARELLRLAALDSAQVPDGALVVAESAGELVAAAPVGGGTAIADPFRRTAPLVEMLELRADQLRGSLEIESPQARLAARVLSFVGAHRSHPRLP